MSNFAELFGSGPGPEGGGEFLVRWRGRQEGPYSASVIENKLTTNQIGLLHEILHEGRWVTIRDFIAERERVRQAERQQRDDEERRQRAEAEQKAREREDQLRAAMVIEERRKNDLLAAQMERKISGNPALAAPQIGLKPHRGGTILALGLIGLFVCAPLCLMAWSMGSSDLQAMDAGIMDVSGRSTTASGRNVGILGTIIWAVGIAVFFLGGGRGIL